MTKSIQSLALAVVYDDANRPSLEVRIDGELLFPDNNFVGCDPEPFLQDQSPLLPGVLPRRLVVNQCSCEEMGCGAIAPLISADDEFVYWSDFRDFVAVFVYPDDTPDASGGRSVDVDDAVFRRDEYEYAVETACRDRSWDTDGRKTRRALQTELERIRPHLEAQGYSTTWVSADDGGKTDVSMWHAKSGAFVTPLSAVHCAEEFAAWNSQHEQVLVRFVGAGTPEERAARVVEFLTENPPDVWPVITAQEWVARGG